MGYPERFAQEALGHNSKAVHRAYARKAKVILPSLESFARQMKAKILPFPAPQIAAESRRGSSPPGTGTVLAEAAHGLLRTAASSPK